jgi:hypothetical protein
LVTIIREQHPTSTRSGRRGHLVAELKKGSRVTGGERDKLAET